MLTLGVLRNAAVAGAVKMKDKAFSRYEYYECKCKTAYNNMNGNACLHVTTQDGLGAASFVQPHCMLI